MQLDHSQKEEGKNIVKMTVSGDNSETIGIAPTEMIFESILEDGVFRFDCSVEHRKAAFPSVSFKNIKDREVPVISHNVPAYTPTCVCLEEKQVVTFEFPPGTSFYGTGEVGGELERTGKRVFTWNTDAWGYGPGTTPLYQSHPWVLVVLPTGETLGVLADTTQKCEIDLRKEGIIRIIAPTSYPIITFGPFSSPTAVLESLSHAIGTVFMPPKWALGYHQCRFSYMSEKRVAEIAQTFRDKKIPADVIWMDIDYMDGFRCFTFDKERFPDPSALANYLHNNGFKAVWMLDPGIKKEEGYSVYDSGSKDDVWVKQADGKPFIGEVWPGPCVFPDYTNSKTRSWWASLVKDFISNGVDGIWNDMNEPAVFNTVTKTMPENNIHCGEDDLGGVQNHSHYHNVYGTLMARSTYEGIKLADKNKRPFVLTRAGFIGSQRYAATWTGDNLSTWEHLHMSISMVLQLGLSGQPLSGPDIGGFGGNATPRLFGRWMGVGAMFPFCRGHSEVATDDHEPWSFGGECEEVCRAALKRRYQLLPHFYTLFYIAHTTGAPVAAPIFFADPKDFRLRTVENAFLLGPLLIYASTLNNQGSHELHHIMPKGTWLRFDFEDSHPDLPTLYLRGGSIISVAPPHLHVGEFTLSDDLTLLVSLDENGKAEGLLFEDDGDGYGYTKGKFLITNYIAEKHSSIVTVKVSKTEGDWQRPKRRVHVRLLLGGGAMLDAWGMDGETIKINVPSEHEVSELITKSNESFKLHMENTKLIPEKEMLPGQKGMELSRVPIELNNGNWKLNIIPWIGGRILSMSHVPSGVLRETPSESSISVFFVFIDLCLLCLLRSQEQINMGPKTRGGMVRRSRRSQGLEAETEFIEITRKSTKMRKLNKGKEVAIEEENIEIRQESADEVPTKVSEDVNEADGDGDGDDPHVEIEVENVIAEEQSQSENGVTEEPSQPREADMEAENGVTQEPSQPREADMEPENGFTQEPSQSREADMEPENGVTQEPSQPREADIETENGISGAEASPSDGKQKKKRGPTKMRKVAKDHQEKVSVSFTELGEHVGPGSVTLSSFLGPLVREHVTVLLDDWRNLDKQTKDTLWEEIQARFDLKEEWQKDSVFKQMGCLWRSGKSRLVSQLRNAKSSTERAALKPSNIRSVQVWSAWVKSRTSSVFKAKSEKYRALRRAQIPHTTSRRGMNRLACEMKKKSEDPKKISRSKVWIAGHTHSDGRPVRPEFAETIEKIISLDSQMDSTSSVNIKEDAVSQVLGVDKPGRVRGLGRGITATKLAFLSARDSKLADLESEIKDLKILVRNLAGNKKNNDDCVSPSEASYVYKEGTRVQLLDWCESKDVVVAEGEFCSAEGTYKIGRIPIGPNAAAVVVKSVSNPKASVWRPTTDVRNLQEAAGCKIPWPIDKLILDSASNNHPVSSDVLGSKNTTVDDLERCKIYDWVKGVEVIAEGFMGSTDPYEMVNNVPLGPNAVVMRVAKVINGKAFLWRPTSDMTTMSDAVNEKIAWPLHNVSVIKVPEDEGEASVRRPSLSPSGSTSSTRSGSKKKCILLDHNNSGRKVAEGRVSSTDPLCLVHHVPLGPNASRVWVEVALIEDASLWRPNSFLEDISDAVGSTVAWPNDKILYV